MVVVQITACVVYHTLHFNHYNLHTYTLNCTGGDVVHSYGRLIPHEFPITDLQQISGPDGIGRITCTVSSGTARFLRPGEELETDGVTQTGDGVTATLVVNPSNVSSFQNRGLYCTDISINFFYLFISSASKFPSHYCNIIIHKENNAYATNNQSNVAMNNDR